MKLRLFVPGSVSPDPAKVLAVLLDEAGLYVGDSVDRLTVKQPGRAVAVRAGRRLVPPSLWQNGPRLTADRQILVVAIARMRYQLTPANINGCIGEVVERNQRCNHLNRL